jgi:hypothetical protein
MAAPASAATGWPLQRPRPALPLQHAISGAAAMARRLATSTPGRVQQLQGQAGYAFDLPSMDTSLTTTVTIPTLTCTGLPGSQTFGIQLSLEIGGAYSMVQTFCFGGQQYNEINFSGQNFQNGGWFAAVPGSQIQMSETRDSAGVTATISEAAPSNTKTVSFPGVTTGGGYVGILDAGVENPTTGGVPPYTAVGFAATDVGGTPLGSYIQTVNYAEQDSVWVANLQDQTSDVGSGDSFSVTNANLTLPTVSLSNPTIDQPATGGASVQFTATLSASSSYPIYVDYATQDQSAQAGTNYTAVGGTFTFPPGTTTQSVSVPILPGPETGGPSNGNKLRFLLNLSNPSYVYVGGPGQATILEGPIVNSVSPMNVPRNGGPGTAVTLTGEDLSQVTSAEFCPVGGGQCLQAIGVSGQSDTSVTVTVPDASGSVGAGQTLTTDAVVTDASKVSSPVNPPGDYLVFGCTQQDVTDGAWQVSGCLTDEANGVDVAQASSAIDGVTLTPPAKTTDAVSYETKSHQVTSNGRSVTVSLPMAGNPAVQIFKGAVAKAVSGPVSFTLPANTKLGGLAISGTVTLTPGSPGQASGKVSVTLPQVLGNTRGTLTFTTATGGTLSNLTVTVPKATFMQLFALSNVTLSYSASGSSGTWNVSGTASTGGQTSTTFSGSLAYSNNNPTSASLTVGTISLAGLLDISNLTVNYNGSWSGSATVAQGGQTGTVSLTFSGPTLTAAEVKTGPVALFGIVNVNSFDLKYGGGSWSLAVTSTVPGGGTASTSLTVANGVISQATLKLAKFTLANAVTIASATVSYAASQPNQQCNTVTGTEIWCGSWDISFPDVSGVVSGVSGSLAFQNGAFASGSVNVSGNVPLIDGVFLTKLGATLTVNPAPAQVTGTAIITFGPKISGVSALSANGDLTRTFPAGGTGGSYDATATVTALPGSAHPLVLGKVTATVPDSGPATADLTLGGGPKGLTVTVGKATATIVGEVKGTFTASTFTLTGTTTITVPLGTFSGSLKADNTGVASCAKIPGGAQVGFEFFWKTGTLDVLDSKGCSERGF